MILNDIQIGLSRFSPKQKAESGNWQHPSLFYARCRLGWFIDPDDRSLVFRPPTARTVRKEASACHLEGIELELTAEQVDGLRWEASQFSQIL